VSYQQLVTNEAGEPLGIETLYDDEPAYWDGYDFGEPFDEDDEPDTTEDGFPHETDLGDEWN
jgi:hypothetical protein